MKYLFFVVAISCFWSATNAQTEQEPLLGTTLAAVMHGEGDFVISNADFKIGNLNTEVSTSNTAREIAVANVLSYKKTTVATHRLLITAGFMCLGAGLSFNMVGIMMGTNKPRNEPPGTPPTRSQNQIENEKKAKIGLLIAGPVLSFSSIPILRLGKKKRDEFQANELRTQLNFKSAAVPGYLNGAQANIGFSISW